MCLGIPGRIVEILDEDEAHSTLRVLEEIGEAYEQELEELKSSRIE